MDLTKGMNAKDLGWSKIGEADKGRSRLLCQVTLFGADFHMEAVKVRTRSGRQVASCVYGKERLDAIHAEFGTSGPLETVRIGRDSYVLIITPYQA